MSDPSKVAAPRWLAAHASREKLHGAVRWESALVIAIAIVFGAGMLISPQFTSSYNLFTACTNIGDLAIMAVPTTLIILTGEIDLSVASVLGLSAELMGDLWIHHWAMPLIIVVCLVMGVCAGAVNGFLIMRVGLPSLAVTIGTLTLYRGLADVVLGPVSVSNFPASYTTVGVKGLPGIPWISWSVAAFVVLVALTWVMLRFSVLGRSLYAIGLNKEAAFHAGIRVKRIKFWLFVFSGLICSAVGVLYAFELSSAGENIGNGLVLQVITIAVLGGLSIFGGKGTIIGVALAAALFALLRSALLLTNSINSNDFQVVSGGILLLSVVLPNMSDFGRRGRETLARVRMSRSNRGGSPAALEADRER